MKSTYLLPSLLCFGVFVSCVRPVNIPAFPGEIALQQREERVYNHEKTETGNLYQAKFKAPHGGFLLPYYDAVLEVNIDKNTGIVEVFAFDEYGKPIIVNDRFEKAILYVRNGYETKNGWSQTSGGFHVTLLHRSKSNYFRGKVLPTQFFGFRFEPELNMSFFLEDSTRRVSAYIGIDGIPSCHPHRVESLAMKEAKDSDVVNVSLE